MSAYGFPQAMRRAAQIVRRRMRGAWTAVRLVAHGTIGVHVLADGRDRLRRARRGWEFHRALDRLTIHRSEDEGVLSAMTNDDEYGVVEARFSPDDVIVDVGAHVGGFTHLCYRRGSRAIHAFEPNPDNYALLEKNVGHLKGVQLDPRAVFRSDSPSPYMTLSGFAMANTGASTVLFGGKPFEDPSPDPHDGQGSVEHHIETVALDEILARIPRVRLLKLDCEGSEFPILLTSRELWRVEEVVGEYHEVDDARMDRLAPVARLAGLPSYRGEQLAARLSQLGFTVTITPTSGKLGLFRAVRSVACEVRGE